LNATWVEFIDEIEADPRIADLADDVRAGLEQIYQDDGTLEYQDAVTWILRQRRSIRERIEAIDKVGNWLKAELMKPHKAGELIRVNLPVLLGWRLSSDR
jgi:hypothetical protein